MRKEPVVFKWLPSLHDAASMVFRVTNESNDRLGGLSLNSLIKLSGFGAGQALWLTGSKCWIPTVLGDLPKDEGDFDLVCESESMCEGLVDGAIGVLEKISDRKFDYTRTALGGHRVQDSNGFAVMDVFPLGKNESIHELLMGYPGPDNKNHLRCAWLMNSGCSISNLIRIVDVDAEKETAYGQLRGLSFDTVVSFTRCPVDPNDIPY